MSSNEVTWKDKLKAYSTRKIAAKIPNGTAIRSDNRVMITVLINAGISEAFSDV